MRTKIEHFTAFELLWGGAPGNVDRIGDARCLVIQRGIGEGYDHAGILAEVEEAWDEDWVSAGDAWRQVTDAIDRFRRNYPYERTISLPIWVAFKTEEASR